MLILAVDTSGKFGSIALAQCERDACMPLEVVALEGGTFSAQLVPQITGLLAKHGFGKRDVEGFAVASGPGSFTGLRVGLAAVKALGEVLQKPIAAVSLLEAVATDGEKPEPNFSRPGRWPDSSLCCGVCRGDTGRIGRTVANSGAVVDGGRRGDRTHT